MQEENLIKSHQNFSFGCENYIASIKENILSYMGEHDLTQSRFIEQSGLPKSTINNLLYGKLNDCKLSTAVAIARTLGISLNELTNAGTIDATVQANMIACRNLPQSSIYLIRWFINHQVALNKQDKLNNTKFISVMEPLYTNDCVLKITNRFRQIDISNLSEDLKSKVFFAIRLSCDFYMPFYSPFDVLLIANDRAPLPREHVIVLIGNNIFFAKQRYENGHYNYYGIRDDRFRCDESGISEVIGYVTGVIPDTSTDGER